MRVKAAKIIVPAVVIALILAAWAIVWVRAQDTFVEARFQGRLFSIPSAVYSVPFELYPGLDVAAAALQTRLSRLNYHPGEVESLSPGEYVWQEQEIQLGLRAFRYPQGQTGSRHVVLSLNPAGRVASIRDGEGRSLDSVMLEPERVGAFHDQDRQDRRIISIENVPELLITAVLAVEDRRFYDHSGIDFRRIAGAFLANLRAGRVVQGGSTLTQQLVKNFYLTSERTFVRKLREAVMSLLLEWRHSKPEILEAYLNEVYMGQRTAVAIHGMGEAARYYFAKEISDLSLGEIGLLAGMIKGPNLYSPKLHPERAITRRNLVLKLLHDEGWVSDELLAEASNEKLGVRAFLPDDNPAPYFFDFLRGDLVAEYGEEILASEGLSVFTTLDAHAQVIARDAVRNGLARLEADFPKLKRESSPLQGAMIVLAPRTGEILAMVGGRRYGQSQFNRAVQMRRQPGSIFKPVVALAALARSDDPNRRFTLATILQDEPLLVPGPTGDWVPTNYDDEFRGSVRLRDAIELSLNVPVARLGIAVGPEKIVATARRMGFVSPLRPLPSLALGSFEVALLEVARAYAVIATGGTVPLVRSYQEVMDDAGNVLEQKQIAFKRAFAPEEVFLVTSLLQGVVDRGTGRGLRDRGVTGPIAGKTGTTNGFRDAWFVAFTPQLLVAVWVGFDDEGSLGVPGSVAALPIVADFLHKYHVDTSAVFVQPSGLEWVAIDAATGLRGGAGCRGELEIFLEGTVPVESCSGSPTRPLDRLFDWLMRGT